MKYVDFICPVCQSLAKKSTGHYNRANKLSVNIYCSKKCSGIARRKEIDKDEKKKAKSEYDRQYRTKNSQKLKVTKRQYHLKTYDPIKEAEKRAKKMPKHVEYCRHPEYRKWKKEYDQKYRAVKFYGEFHEAAVLLFKIEDLIDRYVSRLEKGTFNKSQQRKRLWKNLMQSI